MKNRHKKQNELRRDRKRLQAKLIRLYPQADEHKYFALCPFSLPHDGIIAFSEDGILIVQEKANAEFIDKSRVSDLKAVSGNGCVFFECSVDKKVRSLCKSDMRDFKLYTKVMRDCAGVYASSNPRAFSGARSHKRICPNCRRELLPGEDRCPECSKPLKLIRRMLTLAREYRWKIAAASLTLLVLSLVSVAAPYLNRILVDGYIKSGKSEISYTGFALVILSMAAVQIVQNLLSVLRQYFSSSAGAAFQTKLASVIFDKAQSLSLAQSGEYKPGELFRRINGEAPEVQAFITGDLPYFLELVFKFLLIAVIMFSYNTSLALLIIIPVPILIVMFRLIFDPIHALWHKIWTKSAQCQSLLHDVYSGIRVVKSYRTEQHEYQRYDKASKEHRDITVKSETVWALVMNPTRFLAGIGEFFLLYFVGNKILENSMTFGQLAQFSAYITMIYSPLREFARLPKLLVRFIGSVTKIFDLLDEDEELADIPSPIVREIEGTVELENLSFGYDETRRVLDGINLKVSPGEMIGIIGRSGAGKTTLINLIMRLYDPTGGCIKIDGRDLRDYSKDCVRSQMGAVLQETYLFSGTVYENIAYSKPDASYEEVIKAAKDAGAHQFIMKLPDAYNTVVGEKGYTLSGGERQRIAIARALLRDPKILILDEATSALDTETERIVQDALEKLTRSRTTFAIAHRLSTLRNATRLIVIDKGKIAEAGTHDELMEKGGMYYSLVMAQRDMTKKSKPQRWSV